ncbi:MAG: 30S ribosomal protein S11 [Candidatus Shapirobacteria bacterium]|nr:30S ribosomal protein S11 [Candidatus Shapirobacteria bacterium]MDD5073909.1 30S ribosomal protein S11 [Candidatus Shapirobacteria bacterium]MDD5481575.1 30S ribosomal protein S11 [Candidatus Shapirobacteria bacterium]
MAKAKPKKTVKNKGKKITKKTVVRKVTEAKVYVSATFNNTIVTITDMDGNTICWSSAGNAGFKGTRKQTPFAATVTAEKAAKEAKEKGVKEVEVYVKGPGPGREASLRAIKASGLKMTLIADVTPMPHNGPRPKKKRRGA